MRGEVIREDFASSPANTLVSLHAKRWRSRGEQGVLDAEPMASFLPDVLEHLGEAGLLRLHILSADDEAIATAMVLQSHGMACYYIGGFDPDWSRYSPGSITISAAMCEAAREGAGEFHFLRGQEVYKYRFGAVDQLTFCRRFERVLQVPDARPDPGSSGKLVGAQRS